MRCSFRFVSNVGRLTVPNVSWPLRRQRPRQCGGLGTSVATVELEPVIPSTSILSTECSGTRASQSLLIASSEDTVRVPTLVRIPRSGVVRRAQESRGRPVPSAR